MIVPQHGPAGLVSGQAKGTASVFTRFGPWSLISVLILTGVLRIASTYTTFTETFDEPNHIACGMEWLDKGTYNYERKHTPLVRIAVALPLYLRGIHSHGLPEMPDEGHAILYSGGDYFRNLAWARAGNLPFFVIACLFLALWAHRWYGRWSGVVAVGLFSGLPPVLAHAGLATTDMGALAGMVMAGYAFSLWFDKADWKHSVFLGIAIAFALLCKVSVIPFFGLSVVLIGIWAAARRLATGPFAPQPWSRRIGIIAFVLLVACVGIWSCYHFRFASVVTGHGYRPPTAGLGRLAPLADRLIDARIPLGEFIGGFGSAMIQNKFGNPSYLFGSFRMMGWWYFFPVVLAIKTPLSFLVLTLLGLPIAVRQLWTAQWQRGLPVLFAAGTLISCMTAHLNLGVRHVLPIYPFLALVAGQAVIRLFESARSRMLTRAAVGVILAVFVFESIWPHPDYLASFNVLAGSHPEKIVVGSDLDWGQDLHRLSMRLQQLDVRSLKIAYFGMADLKRSNLPEFSELGGNEHAGGWVAISLSRLMADCAARGDFCWYQTQKSFERVGRSILLFHFPPQDPDGAGR